MAKVILARRRYENPLGDCGFAVVLLAVRQVYLYDDGGERFVEKMNDYLKYKDLYSKNNLFYLVSGVVLGIILSKLLS